MKNICILCSIAAIIGFAVFKGMTIRSPSSPVIRTSVPDIPYIGRIQILNGCGSSGAAHLIADYLRKKHFDVKNIDNADSWNYHETLVISRTKDTTIALQVAAALSMNTTVLIRNQELLYDVTVIVGNDYREHIQ